MILVVKQGLLRMHVETVMVTVHIMMTILLSVVAVKIMILWQIVLGGAVAFNKKIALVSVVVAQKT
jgi:hypothetical protein